ncbi:Xaa-Pro peptidase family protein [Thermococcus aggregans]|uniref:Xaa-Pro peptidase family protein n=1 Tax=Thermococcus aggregans TaxID=110163 RepID=A0A9E7SMT4_THEAG|nr:Xaa-Pro peptidase family protein [Thermococcus aggregans]
MEKYDLDVLVSTTPENVLYLSNYQSVSHKLLKEVQIYAVFPRDLEPVLIIPMSDLDLYADNPSWIKDVRTYGTFYIEEGESTELSKSELRLAKLQKIAKPGLDPFTVLTNVLSEKGLDKSNIGLDEMGIDYVTQSKLKAMLPEANFKPAYNILREIRMIKTKEEIELLRKSAEISQKAVERMLESVKEGVTERELAQELEEVIVRNGAKPFLTVLGCGTRSAFPNALPSDYKVKKGDIIRFDGGCEYKGYYSDIAKIAVLERANEKVKKYFKAIALGVEEAANAIEPGVKASEIFQIAMEAVKKAGIPHYRRHHVGHGIGAECYDPPILRPSNQTVLEPDMVINIETPYYEFGLGGLQVEITIRVTQDGYELLTPQTFDNDLLII